jgi:diguanylate cyclase (GGDEF)-like protein
MKILLIEDDDITRELLAEELSAARYAVEQAADGELGLALASLWSYDLILLDLQIPKLDGLTVCRQLRERGITTPILMLTAQTAQEDIVTGLDTGADDYVTKPFEVGQVLARIRALLRRGSMTNGKAPALTWGKLSLDPATTLVTYDNRPIPITPKEYSLLELFLRNPHRVFSRSNILDHLWTMDDSPTEGAVTNLVKDLRNRLKQNGVKETVVQTVYGLGYRLKQNEAQQEQAEAESRPKAVQGTTAPTTTLASIVARFQNSLQQRVEILEEVTRAFQAGGMAAPQRELACEEAHRLAGGLGTFGYEEGSALARQMEKLLEGKEPLDPTEIAKLSQNLLALKQVVVSQPVAPSGRDVADSTTVHILVAIGIPNSILLPLKTVASSRNWSLEVMPAVEDFLRQDRAVVGEVILLYLQPARAHDEKWSTLSELKRRWPKRPVIVLSPVESLEDRVQAVRLGADRYLVAPCSPDKLMDSLAELVTPSPLSEPRVLVVETDPAVCDTVEDLLTPWGVKVTVLNNAAQFWEVLRSADPHLLLLAEDMPTFGGINLCQVVRQDSQYGDLPILMLTSQPNHIAVRQVFELGYDDVVTKPIISPELITRVLSRIERSQLRQQLDAMRQQQILYWQRQEQLDPITLIANDRYFSTLLQQQWERHRQDQAPIALILCTPDRLEDSAQPQSQWAIDQLLRQVAQILQSTINPNIDLAARYSDDAFAIVLPNTNRDGVLRVVNRIQQAIQPMQWLPSSVLQPGFVTLSLGVGVTVPNATQLCDELLKGTDQALKAAKANGGNTYCWYPE